MSTLTKEWLLKTIAELEEERDAVPGAVNEDAAMALEAMKIALASLEAEAVCVIDQSNLDYLNSGSDADVWPASRTEMGDVLLYRIAPPAPVSVPDEDLLHMAASAIEDLLSSKDRSGAGVWADIPAKLRRAAMLQGADGALINEGTIPVTQFKPVADLYGLTSPTGSETSFTFDAVEARDFIDGGWSCQEYVELERFQVAMIGNSPVDPDGWVACSERMPEHDDFVYVWPRPNFGVELHVAQYGKFDKRDAGWYAQVYEQNYGIEYHPITVTHWMPLPASPQQK